jgi:hypothetical protein
VRPEGAAGIAVDIHSLAIVSGRGSAEICQKHADVVMADVDPECSLIGVPAVGWLSGSAGATRER